MIQSSCFARKKIQISIKYRNNQENTLSYSGRVDNNTTVNVEFKTHRQLKLCICLMASKCVGYAEILSMLGGGIKNIRNI